MPPPPHSAKTVPDWIAHHARTTPDKLALRDLSGGRDFSYRQMDTRVAGVAGLLTQAGVGPGDRVAYLMPNSTDTIELIFAAWRCGAIAVAVNFRLAVPEVLHILDDSGARLLLIDREMAEIGASLREARPNLTLIETDGMGGASPFEAGADTAAAPARPDIAPGDPAMLMYSSGTTGRPKGVILTHGMIEASVHSFLIAADIGARAGVLVATPIFHIAALIMAMNALYPGGTALVARSFDPGAFLDAVDQPALGVTHALVVPAILRALLAHPHSETTDMSRLRALLAGAEKVPPDLITAWRDRGVPVREGYGMTESTATNAIFPDGGPADKVGSIGVPLMHVEMAVLTTDGAPCPDGTVGELVMRGPVVTPGYWNNPEATAAAQIHGWFRTGDLGLRDADGYFYIRDRAKDMYISGGENVYPAEVESVLHAHPAIAEAAVIGVPDVRWGEAGCAFVVTAEPLEAEAVLAHCRAQMAGYKCPTTVRFVAALPRNATGKVQKFRLRQDLG